MDPRPCGDLSPALKPWKEPGSEPLELWSELPDELSGPSGPASRPDRRGRREHARRGPSEPRRTVVEPVCEEGGAKGVEGQWCSQPADYKRRGAKVVGRGRGEGPTSLAVPRSLASQFAQRTSTRQKSLMGRSVSAFHNPCSGARTLRTQQAVRRGREPSPRPARPLDERPSRAAERAHSGGSARGDAHGSESARTLADSNEVGSQQPALAVEQQEDEYQPVAPARHTARGEKDSRDCCNCPAEHRVPAGR
eukprot:scaffold6580_cov29-Tisochrysis_lutea.AAC.11